MRLLKNLLQEYSREFDSRNILSKLQTSSTRSNRGDVDVRGFVLEDENGNLIKIFVAATQANAFEKELAEFMKDYENDSYNDNKMTNKEIGEIIFDLKDRFDIIDIEWGNVEEDEEEIEEPSDIEGQPEDEDTVADEEELPSDEETDMENAENTDDVKDLLQKFIEILKADADAKIADAAAREAEFRAKEASEAAKLASEKMKREQEYLDMEDYYKRKQEEDSESKRMAKLAKYKHEISSDEEEEVALTATQSPSSPNDMISLDDLLKLIQTRGVQQEGIRK